MSIPAERELSDLDTAELVDPMLPRRFRLVDTRQQTPDTYTLQLVPLGGPPLRYSPGQFTMLDVFGVGEVPISMSGDALFPGPLEYTIRDVGVITHAIVTSPIGTTMGVRGPFGTAWEVSQAEGCDIIFVAGGVGLAPLRPALLEVEDHRDRFGQVVLLYGARSSEDFLFVDDVARWSTRCDITTRQGVRAGLAELLAPPTALEAGRVRAFMCGPDVMMSLAADSLVEHGVPPANLRMSLERNMKCGVGLCGHCQLREMFMCVDGPVMGYDVVASLLAHKEL
jgi:NAD(P)H-flavin reductase